MHFVEIVLLELSQRVDLCLEGSLLLGLLAVSEGTGRALDKHVVRHLRLGLELILRQLQHLVVSLWQSTLRCRRATLVLYRSAPKVLLVRLVIEFLWLEDLPLLLPLRRSSAWRR